MCCNALSGASLLISLLIFFFLFVIILVDETSLDFVEDNLMGSLEGFFEAFLETGVAGGSLCLLLTSSLGSLLNKSSSAGLSAGLDSGSLGGTESLGSRVEFLHHNLVLERVLLTLGCLLSADLLHAELGLDLVRVDDSSEVGAGHHVSSKLEALLLLASFTVGTEESVQLLEGVLCEDDETAEMTTRGELEKVQSLHVAGVNTGEVSGSLLDEVVLFTVDDQRTTLEDEAAVAHLSSSRSELLGRASAGEVTTEANVTEALEELRGLLNVKAVDDERELGHIINFVTTGHDEGTAGSSGESRSNSVSLLVGVNLSLPLSPDLEGSEHATLAALVTESTLAGTVSTGTRDTGNTGDGTTSTPRLGGVLVAGVPEDTATLSSVLGHVGVAELNDIISDGSSEDGGHLAGASDLLRLGSVHANSRTGSHSVWNKYGV